MVQINNVTWKCNQDPQDCACPIRKILSHLDTSEYRARKVIYTPTHVTRCQLATEPKCMLFLLSTVTYDMLSLIDDRNINQCKGCASKRYRQTNIGGRGREGGERGEGGGGEREREAGLGREREGETTAASN